MATTASWLQNNDYADLAFVLAFDGVPLLYTTTSDTDGITTAWSGTDWSGDDLVIYSGLDIVGSLEHGISLFSPEVSPQSLGFRIADPGFEGDNSLASLFIKNKLDGVTALATANLSASGVSLEVDSDTAFTATGHVYCGLERIQYTGKAGAPDYALTGLTRGKCSLFGVDGGTRIGQVHNSWHSVASAKSTTNNPLVSDAPRLWYNRMVGLYVHHKESGVWSTKANSRLLWAGRIEGFTDNGNGAFALACRGIEADLLQPVFHTQFNGKVQEGINITASTQDWWVQYDVGGTMARHTSTFDVGASDYTDIISQLNEQFNAWKVASTTPADFNFYAEPAAKEEGARVVLALRTESGTTMDAGDRISIAMHRVVWDLLGFTQISTYSGAGSGVTMEGRFSVDDSDEHYADMVADASPRLFVNPELVRPGSTFDTITIDTVTGSWATQDDLPITVDSRATGILKIGDKLFAASASGTTFSLYDTLNFARATSDTYEDQIIRLDEANEAPVAKQIFWAKGTMGDILLKLMLSTGASAYNHATYDDYDDNIGLALPSNLLDVDSFERLREDFEVFLEEPTEFNKILEPALAATGKYITFRDGTIACVFPGWELSDLEEVIELTENDKPALDSRCQVEYSSDGIVNVINLNLEKSKSGLTEDITKHFTVQNYASISDYGRRRALTITAPGLIGPEAFMQNVVEPILANFSRPIGIIRFPISARALHVEPCDIVKITDNYIVDPDDGDRGISGRGGWVRSKSFNWRSGTGELEIIFLPYHDISSIRRLAPSAATDITQGNGGLDAGTSTVFYTNSHEFTRTTDNIDSSFFAAGDKIHIIEKGASGAPLEWDRTVDSVGTDTITVTAAIADPAWDNSKYYTIEFQGKAACETAQKDKTFLALKSTRTTGDATLDYSLYTAPDFATYGWWDTDTPVSTNLFVRPYSNDSTQGEPLSAHKFWYLFDNLNNTLSYRTRNCLVNQVLEVTYANATQDWYLAYGPVWIPLYGENWNNSTRRGLDIYALITCTGGIEPYSGKVRATTCKYPCYGSSQVDVSFTGDTTSVTYNSTGGWVHVGALNPVIATTGWTSGTWFTLETNADRGSGTITLIALAVIEDNL
jgi:hypothetical protein